VRAAGFEFERSVRVSVRLSLATGWGENPTRRITKRAHSRRVLRIENKFSRSWWDWCKAKGRSSRRERAARIKDVLNYKSAGCLVVRET